MATPSTLADPTDYGNKPGDGPLRRGGTLSGEIVKDTDRPSTRSTLSSRQVGAVGMLRDLFVGVAAIRGAGTTYLPRAPGEDASNYAERLARSVFINYLRRTVEGLAGLIFRKDPVLGDDVPEAIQVHWENIDNEGTHGDLFVRDIEQDALLAGHAAILVEYPRTGGGQTLADEIALNLRPYWLPIKKENIVSWRSTNEGGVRVLNQLVLEEKTWEPVGMYGEQEVTRYRVFYRENGVVGFELVQVLDDHSLAIIDQGTYPTQDEIPVVEVATSGSESLFVSTPPLLDLGYLNIAHYQQYSDYAYAMYKTNVPFLFSAGVPELRDQNGQLVPLVVGPNTYVNSSDAGAKMEYVAHDGQSLGASRIALEDLKGDMGTLGLAMLSPQKRVAETAEAKRLDKSTSDSALSVNARCLQDALERALYFHARYMRLPVGGSVTINRDFEGLLMDAPVMSAYAQLVNAGFPSRPVLEALQAGGRIADDADLDVLGMEWMMGAELNRQIPPEPVEEFV